MLGALRTFVGSWAAKILLVLLVGSFAVWGVSGTIFSGANTNTVASVGETNVTVTDYLATYNRNLNQTSQQVGRALTQEQARILGVEQRTLSDVVTSATLDEFSREMNMSLSEDMLATALRENPAFQGSDGRFDRLAFQNAVRRAGLRENDYIRLQNGNAIRGQVMEGIAEGDLLPKVFSNALAAYASEERQFDYIIITPALAGEPAAATDEQLKTYFEANKKTYAAPEFRKLSILALEPKDILNEAAITDEAVQQDYEKRIAAYSTPEKRRVQQIVLTKKKAEAAKASLASGATFETVLTENNVKLADADLGLIEKSSLPKAFQDAAFSLEPNEVSKVLDGPFGSTLLRVTEIQQADKKPLSEVAADIRKELALTEAADQVVVLQTEMEDVRAGGATLKEAADRLNLKVREIEAIDATARTPDGIIINDLPESRELLREAFRTEIGDQTSPIDFNTIGSVWYEVLDITPARDRSLDEVKDKVAADWMKEQRAKQAQTKAEELKAQLQGGKSLQDIATGLATDVKQTKLLKRQAAEETFPAAAVIAGYAGDAKAISIADAAGEGSKILLKVAQIKRPEAQISQPIEQEVQRANAGAGNDLLEQLITNLQSGYSVNYNPQLMEQALARR